MGLQQVKEEIIDKAERAAEDIQEEADEEAQEIIAEAKQQASEIKEEAKEKAEKEAESLRKEKIASANMEAQRLKLQAKQDVINEAFEELEDRIYGLDKAKRLELVQTVIDRVGDEIDIGRVKTSEDLVSDVEDMVDADVEAADLHGVIVEDGTGSVRYDYSFETVLENVKKDGRQKAARELF